MLKMSSFSVLIFGEFWLLNSFLVFFMRFPAESVLAENNGARSVHTTHVVRFGTLT